LFPAVESWKGYKDKENVDLENLKTKKIGKTICETIYKEIL